MWSKWKARFKEFGADRIEFVTSTKGGLEAGKVITGAKCLLIFKPDESRKYGNFKKEITLEYVANQITCRERMKATICREEDFGFLVKDSTSKNYYGTKVGYPILEFSPAGATKSKGKEKHRPGLIISRAFKIRKHRQWLEGNVRETTYSFPGTEGIVFVVHLKGKYWGKPLHMTPKIQTYMNTTRLQDILYMTRTRVDAFMISNLPRRYATF